MSADMKLIYQFVRHLGEVHCDYDSAHSAGYYFDKMGDAERDALASAGVDLPLLSSAIDDAAIAWDTLSDDVRDVTEDAADIIWEAMEDELKAAKDD